MVDIEEFKLAHKDDLLQHSFNDLIVMATMLDSEILYTVNKMHSYVLDVKHVLQQGLDVSVISHITYNLNLQFLHCYKQTNKYYEASRYYMFDNYALNIKERTSEYQEARKDIKELVNNLDEISLFEIYCAHPADFIGDEHYRRGIEDKNKPLLNLERELSFMNGVQLLKCLEYLMELTEKKILDIRNGITYVSDEILELVYDLNYVFYADNYWESEKKRLRSYVEEYELMGDVNTDGLQKYHNQLLHDFVTNEVGRVWKANSENKKELLYELIKLPLKIDQWEYYFKTIFQLEELKRWKNELKIAISSTKSRSKAKQVNKQKPRETMTFKSGKNVLEGHLTLLFRKLVKDGWIEGNEADFKALFSGKRDEDCVLTWSGEYGKANLVKLIMELDKAGLIVVPKGYAITPILEGHFKDNSGQWLSGLDKMNTPSTKALTVIHECIKLLKTEPRRLMDGDYQDNEDFQSIYDPYDQDLQLHQR